MSMKAFNTRLTRLLGTKTPIVSAPMAGAAGGELAGRVSAAGGFGFLSAGYGLGSDQFKQQLDLARNLCAPSRRIPVGVGYLAWQLEKPQSPLVDLLLVALDQRVQAVWFAFGADIEKWISIVREHDRRTGEKTLIFVQVSTAQEAVVAAREWKVDCIVAQGIESGGHGAGYALPVVNLVPSILDSLSADRQIPILAAGGLTNGSHLAAILTLGADGAVLGTRFLLAKESLYSRTQKSALLAASSEMSVRSMAWDHARDTLGWPTGVDGRGLKNAIVRDFERGVDVASLRKQLEEGTAQGDPDRMIIWAGTGIGQINVIKPAEEIVKELHMECMDHLKTAANIIQ